MTKITGIIPTTVAAGLALAGAAEAEPMKHPGAQPGATQDISSNINLCDFSNIRQLYGADSFKACLQARYEEAIQNQNPEYIEFIRDIAKSEEIKLTNPKGVTDKDISEILKNDALRAPEGQAPSLKEFEQYLVLELLLRRKGQGHAPLPR